jgi:hypothetical protein
VSSTWQAGHGTPQAVQAALRKPTSNGALCAMSTRPRAKLRNPGRTAVIGGAWATMALLMPVSTAISGGMARPGLTSAVNSSRTRPPLILTAPISVMLDSSGDHPVVSTSTTVKSIPSNAVAVRRLITMSP